MNDPLVFGLTAFPIFLFGLALGSFVNAVVWRLATGKSWTKGFSVCPHCGRRLAARDLVPVASFLLLRGRCRHCRKRISLQYPLVEAGVAIALVLAWLRFGPTVPFGVSAVMVLLLAILFVFDARYHLLPDAVTLPGIGLAFVGGLLLGHSLLEVLAGGILGGTFFLLQFVLSRGRWIGGGDIRLGALIGLLVGWRELLLVLFLAYVSGALVGVALIVRRQKTLKSHVPFGTFLTAACFASVLYGAALIAWYVNGVLP